MTRHDDHVRLRPMLDHAREAVHMVQNRDRGDLSGDRMLELAPVRLVEIIGEAAGRVTEETRKALPTVPWLAIVGMRNRLIHGYDTIDLDVLQDTVEEDLPALIAALELSVDEGSAPSATAPA